MLKLFIKEYLTFSKKERTGIFVLLAVILLLLIAPLFFPFFIHQKEYDHRQFEKEIQSLAAMQSDSTSNINGENADEKKFSHYNGSAKERYSNYPGAVLFDFDPNALPVEGWRKIGLREKTIQTIQNYLSKGGRFNKPEDISKIWGISENDVQRLLPHVKIKEKFKEENKQYYKVDYLTTRPDKELYKNKIIDINTADTTAWKSLPGIGSKLAARIVLFRDKLGGFYKTEQVAETFGLPDSTYQQIKTRLMIGTPVIRKLNINTATVEEMRSHPYFRYAIANAIVRYRTQHGNFTAVKEIKNIILVTEDVFNKIAPYLVVE